MVSQEIRQIIKEESGNVLRLYAAFFTAPSSSRRHSSTRPSGEPFHWPPTENARPTSDNMEATAERAT